MLSSVCQHCNKGFTDPKVFAEHVKSHPEVSGSRHPIRPRPYSCRDCSFACSTRLDLLKHKQIHRDVQIVYSCLACSERFGDPVLYSQHFSGHKSEVNVFECCMCRQICKTLQDLKNHENAHLELSEKAETETLNKQDSHVCPYCAKSFQSDSRLMEHVSIHEGYRKLRCGSCDEGFTSPAALQQHEEETNHGPLALVKTPLSSSSSTADNNNIHSPTSTMAPSATVAKPQSEVPVPLVDSDDEPIEVVEPEAPDSPEHDDSQYANDFVIHDNPMPVVEMNEKQKASENTEQTKTKEVEKSGSNGDKNEEDDPHLGDKKDLERPQSVESSRALSSPSSHSNHEGGGAAAIFPGPSMPSLDPGPLGTSNNSSSGIGSPWAADMHNHNFSSAYGSFFCCSICDAQLASFQECEAHCFSEHYRYPCMYCTKTFAQKANRDRHLCIHTGERPFACPECDQRFARGDKLKIHRMKWHNIQYNTPYMRMPRAGPPEREGAAAPPSLSGAEADV